MEETIDSLKGKIDMMHSIIERDRITKSMKMSNHLDFNQMNPPLRELDEICGKFSKINQALDEYKDTETNRIINRDNKPYMPEEIIEYNKISRELSSLVVQTKQYEHQYEEAKQKRLDQEELIKTVYKNYNPNEASPN